MAGAGVLERVEAILEFVEPGKIASFGSMRMICVEAVSKQGVNDLRAPECAERLMLQAATRCVFSKGMEKPLHVIRR